MKVKELLQKYPEYDTIYMGKKHATPFTLLPKELRGLTGKEFDKKVQEYEVKDYEVVHKERKILSFTMNLKYKGRKVYPGYMIIII